ncbi:MAG: DNA-binding protein [Rhodoferax sp.]
MTSDQVKSRLRRQGITITQWAVNHGYPRSAVYRVLNGIDKAHFGRAHEIAVALGLKAPEQLAA